MLPALVWPPMSRADRVRLATSTVEGELAGGKDLQDAIFDAARAFRVAPAAIWRELEMRQVKE